MTSLHAGTAVLAKSAAGLDPALILINKDWHRSQPIDLTGLAELPRPRRLLRPFSGAEPQPLPAGPLALEPAEIALCLP